MFHVGAGPRSATLLRRSAFNDHNADPPVLPDTAGPLTYSQYMSTVLPKPTLPGASQSLPTQEPGGRRHVGR